MAGEGGGFRSSVLGRSALLLAALQQPPQITSGALGSGAGPSEELLPVCGTEGRDRRLGRENNALEGADQLASSPPHPPRSRVPRAVSLSFRRSHPWVLCYPRGGVTSRGPGSGRGPRGVPGFRRWRRDVLVSFGDQEGVLGERKGDGGRHLACRGHPLLPCVLGGGGWVCSTEFSQTAGSNMACRGPTCRRRVIAPLAGLSRYPGLMSDCLPLENWRPRLVRESFRWGSGPFPHCRGTGGPTTQIWRFKLEVVSLNQLLYVNPSTGSK